MYRLGSLIAATAALSIGCTRDVASIETRKLPQPNPTTYTFAYPLTSLHDQALNIFTIDRQVKEPIFGRSADLSVPAMLHVEESKNALFGADLLNRPKNEADLYLHGFHDPLWESPVYRGPRGGLRFLADFHVHLSPVDDRRTAVSVTAVKTEVINGMAFGFGHGPGWHNLYVSVSPTSVEEYTILRYLGGALGVQGMPEVVLPP